MTNAKIRSILLGLTSITVGLGTLGVPYAAEVAEFAKTNSEVIITVGAGIWATLAGLRK